MRTNQNNAIRVLLMACLVGCIAVTAQGVEPLKPEQAREEIRRRVAELALPEKLEEAARRTAEVQKLSEEVAAKMKADTERRRQEDEENPYSVGNKNFIVQAVGRSVSEMLLKRADEQRRESAKKHLGKELPPKKEFTIISIEIDGEDDGEEECDVWLCGKGRAMRGANRVWITAATKERAAELLEEAIEKIVLDGEKLRVPTSLSN